LIEAVGRLRDARSRPVLIAITKHTSEFEIVRAAVEALGRLGDDKSTKHLVAAVKRGGDKQLAILGGIGECRRAVVADTLAAMAAKLPRDSARATSLIKALGAVGNSWAWQTPDVSKSGEGAKVRSAAAKALLQLYIAYDGDLRQKAAKAILLVDDPSTPALIENAKLGASSELATALDMLAAQLAQNPVR
jgi:HEAT repeat protein